jgi:protein required for attachment to host cells
MKEGTCVVVADGGRARFFEAQAADGPRVKVVLVERAAVDNPDLRERGTSVTGRPRTETNTNRQAGPVHPIGAQRERHRLALDRRFGQEIARRAGAVTRSWKAGTVVLIAAPRLLGLMRAPLRGALGAGVELKELAQDYAGLTAPQIRDRLTAAGQI